MKDPLAMPKISRFPDRWQTNDGRFRVTGVSLCRYVVSMKVGEDWKDANLPTAHSLIEARRMVRRLAGQVTP